MELNDIKSKFKAFIFAIFSIIITIILIRMFLILIGANEDTPFVKFWNEQLSYAFIAPFEGIYNTYIIEGIRIETSSFIAFWVYIIFSFIFVKFFLSFLESDPRKIIINFIDTIFKIIEFALLLRFAFRLTDANESTGFASLIITISSIVYEPFRNILPEFTFGDRNQFLFETSTFIAVIIVIVIDVVTEGILSKFIDKKEKKENFPQNDYYPNNYYPTATPTQQTPQNMNITINVPQQNLPSGVYQEQSQYYPLTSDSNQNFNSDIPQFLNTHQEPPKFIETKGPPLKN